MNWSQRSTTREPSSDEDDDRLRLIKAEPRKVALPCKLEPNPPDPATPRKRMPLQQTSPNFSVEQPPAASIAVCTTLARSRKVDDSAICLEGDGASFSPARPCALARTPAMIPAMAVDAGLGSRPSYLLRAASTLRHVLQSSIIHLPSAHDVALRPDKHGGTTPGAVGLPLRHALSSPDQLRRSRSSSHLERLDLTRSESFRKILLQNDRDAVLLLDPDCPRFQHDLETYRRMSDAVSSPRAKIRVLSAWCVREQGRALDGSWERFRLGEL